MKKKIIVNRLKEILTKKYSVSCKADFELKQLEDINELFNQEKQDQIKLCHARNIGTEPGLYGLLQEVLKRWKAVIDENPEFQWLFPRLKNFLDELEKELKEEIVKAGRGEIHWRLDHHAREKKYKKNQSNDNRTSPQKAVDSRPNR